MFLRGLVVIGFLSRLYYLGGLCGGPVVKFPWIMRIIAFLSA